MENYEIKNLSFTGILVTSTRIVTSATHRRHFAHLTASLFLPFSLLFLLQNCALHLQLFPSGNLGGLCFFLSAIALSILFLIPASAVAVSIAAILIGAAPKAPTFALSHFPTKRLLSTFAVTLRNNLLCTLVFLLLANAIAEVLSHLPPPYKPTGHTNLAILFILGSFYLYEMMHIGATWLFASVTSVLEDSRGNAAIERSQRLVGRDMGGTLANFYGALLFLLLGGGCQFIRYVLEEDRARNSLEEVLWEGRWFTVVKEAVELGFWARFGIGLGFLVVFTAVSLFGMVVFTLVYFVRKSSSREGLDMLRLAQVAGGEQLQLPSSNKIRRLIRVRTI